MVGSQKILTVSYGTFSCTLEGFDDAFETMKAIAEYFRDLAADDRYFGAEPPTPDAQMLARIAEREVSRRVEARMEPSGIVLRVGETGGRPESVPEEAPVAAPAPARPPVAAAPAPVAEPAPVAAPAPALEPIGAADEPVAPPAVQPAGPVEPEPNAQLAEPVAVEPEPEARVLPAHPDPDSVAAKLQRIRAVVGREGARPIAEDEPSAPASVAPEDPGAPEVELPMAVVEGAGLEGDELALVEKVAALAGAAEVEAFEASDASPPAAALAAEAVAVAAEEGAPTAQDAVLWDGEWEEEDGEAELARHGREAPAVDEAAFDGDGIEDAEIVEAVAPEPEPAREPIRPRVVRMRREEYDQVVGATAARPEAGHGAGLTPEAEAELMAELASLEAELGPVEEDAPEPRAVATEVWEEPEPEPELALDDRADEGDRPAAEAQPSDDLDEDERSARDAVGSLLATLGQAAEPVPSGAAVEEEVAQAWNEPETGEAEPAAETLPAVATVQAPAPRRVVLPERLPDADEAGMSRLLSRVESEAADPESIRRREAIAQLKAAVAATEAARRMGESPTPRGERTEPFRDDLRQVVRPRRPMPAIEGPRVERPRPAPLKLVASQRVDLPAMPPAEPAMAGPVRPRRVTVEAAAPAAVPVAAPVAAAGGQGSFAAFAAEMGAQSLTDILEAAAAYTAFVEGAEDFSRPQIIGKVRQVADGDFSREDGLRSFGTLLREGRILRVRGGRFQVSEETRFRPDRRAG